MSENKVAYILLRFPHLTETFVAEEINAVNAHGTAVHIFSLLNPIPGPIHPVSRELSKGVTYAPGFLTWQLCWAQLYFLARNPLIYFRLLVELLREPCPVFDFYLKRLVIFLKAVSLAKEIKGTSVKLIHTHFAWLSGAATRVIAELLGLPYTTTTHAYDIYSVENDLLCLTARSAAHIVTISEYNKREILQRCPDLVKSRISVIHCGIDVDTFVPGQRSHNDTVSIVSVGSLIEKKGHEYLIRACGRLKARGLNFKCIIIGRGRDEPQLQKLVAEQSVGDRVTLAGAQEQSAVLETYRSSDIFVLACVVDQGKGRDGIPVAMMEALAMELPVVSTHVSGIPELVHHKETGLLVPPRDDAALADAIEELSRAPVLREHMGRNGRALVIDEFEIQKNARRLANLFVELIKEQEK
jgi:glycosyltransferase involved in cell wall biosynthesis